jgi:hypothetical protein
MQYKEFESILELYRKTSVEFSELYNIGFDFYEGKYKLSESFYNIFIKCLGAIYTPEGIEWIDWFVLEAEYGTNGLTAFDENGNEICNTIESLYNYVEENHKIVNDK